MSPEGNNVIDVFIGKWNWWIFGPTPHGKWDIGYYPPFPEYGHKITDSFDTLDEARKMFNNGQDFYWNSDGSPIRTGASK